MYTNYSGKLLEKDISKVYLFILMKSTVLTQLPKKCNFKI